MKSVIDYLEAQPAGSIVGLQAVQGSGKTTLCNSLSKKFTILSLDDFYLPCYELAILYKDTCNELYSVRGNPGTHDVQRLVDALDLFRRRVPIKVPIYDKYAHDGRGDRIGWKMVQPADVLILEGWCVGFTPVSDDSMVDKHLVDYQRVFQQFDAMVVLKPPYLDIVYKWREEAEAAVRAHKTAMTKSQVVAFVDKYMPTYKTYLPELYQNSTCFQLDESRNQLLK
jgi:D-glycerate 3-kinase